MGTSQSSSGPGPNVPLVPPWTPPLPPETSSAQEAPASGTPASPEDGPPEAAPVSGTAPAQAPGQLALPRRFNGTRISLGRYARDGDRADLRRGLGRYVRNGYRGTTNTLRRFGSTVATAGALDAVLRGGAGPAGTPIERNLLAGKSAEQIMDAVVEAARPINGTQDAEAGRASIRDALSEVLTRFPEADLLDLDAEQREFVLERFTAVDVANRFELDLGQTILEKAPNASTALARIKEAREYIRECVSASFRKLRSAGAQLSSGRVGQIVRDALRDAFDVFQGYAE